MNSYHDIKYRNICERLEHKFMPSIYFEKCKNTTPTGNTFTFCCKLRKLYCNLVI